MVTLLNITLVIICVLLIIVVLVQNKNVTLNLTSMGGAMGSVTKRGGEKVLHVTTIVLGTLFTLNALALFLIK